MSYTFPNEYQQGFTNPGLQVNPQNVTITTRSSFGDRSQVIFTAAATVPPAPGLDMTYEGGGTMTNEDGTTMSYENP
jgi:hypothetical protein